MFRDAGPAMSIVVVADQYETIRQTIRHLKAQTGREQLELVIVMQSAERLGLDCGETADFCHVRVVGSASREPRVSRPRLGTGADRGAQAAVGCRGGRDGKCQSGDDQLG